MNEHDNPKYAYTGHNPGVIDFIKKCRNTGEAIEIVEFMMGRGEITSEQGKKIINQVTRYGIKSFFREKKKKVSDDDYISKQMEEDG